MLLTRRNTALIMEISTPAPASQELHFKTRYSQPFYIQCMACLRKQYWSYWRNPPYTAVRFIFTTFIALLLGTAFWDLGSKRTRRQDILNAMGSMYVTVLLLVFQNATSVQPVVAVERTVLYRERAAGMYSAFPCAFGECTFYGMMTVAVTPYFNIAAIVSSFFYRIWNVFSGFIIPRSRIPIWWRWYYWCCPVAWTLQGLVASQWGNIEDTFESGETVKHFLGGYFDFRDHFVCVVAIAIVGICVPFGFIFAFSTEAFNFQKRW